MADILEEKIFANALNQIYELGSKGLIVLKNHFGSFENAWRASKQEIEKIADLKDFNDLRKNIDPEKEWQKLLKNNIKVLLPQEKNYPSLLLETPYPPAILYLKGQLPEQNNLHLAVVGTRRLSAYGKESCRKIVEGLSQAKVVIVSGLASGIDTIAHKTALENGAKTIAVLGSGLSEKALFPAENKKLAQNIAEKGGALISEYPYEMRAARFTFAPRNRIIAGISSGALVVEAPEKSGALITANFALEYNRDVFAVPGSIFSQNSQGANALIKMGAKPVTEAEDILREYGLETNPQKPISQLSEKEKIILSALSEPMPADEVIMKTAFSAEEVNSILSMLEIQGLIKNNKGEIYKL